jgi:hypothetical protein
MGTSLHITNGDAAGAVLKRSGLGGDVLPWRDTMFEGPFPAGLDLAATSRVRAAYLAGLGLPEDRIRADFAARDAALGMAGSYDAVTLWFEHDLLDQLQLLQVLDRFADADLGDTDLGMVCIGDFPGIDDFRGLGQLDPQQMASLMPRRAPVTDAQRRLGREGWAAFRAPDPRAVERFLAQDLTPLPYMSAALTRHLEEFPSAAEGVGRTHLTLLRLVGGGIADPDSLFAGIMAQERVLYMGDWSTFRRIDELLRPRAPLLACRPFGVFRWPPGIALLLADFRQQRLSLTEAGRQVLAGARRTDAMAGFDYWLGGVHFANGAAPWYWNGETQRLQPAAAP